MLENVRFWNDYEMPSTERAWTSVISAGKPDSRRHECFSQKNVVDLAIGQSGEGLTSFNLFFSWKISKKKLIETLRGVYFLIIRVKSAKHKSFLVVVFFVESEGLYSFVRQKKQQKTHFFFNTTTLCKFHLFIGGLSEIHRLVQSDCCK